LVRSEPMAGKVWRTGAMRPPIWGKQSSKEGKDLPAGKWQFIYQANEGVDHNF
jgi:hypothetical protein